MSEQANKKSAKSEEASSDKHPKHHKVNVVMNDGTKFEVLTSWGKEGDTLNLDIDPSNHPAWQENQQSFINANDVRVKEFEKKFGNLNFLSTPKEEKKVEAKKEESAKEEVKQEKKEEPAAQEESEPKSQEEPSAESTEESKDKE